MNLGHRFESAGCESADIVSGRQGNGSLVRVGLGCLTFGQGVFLGWFWYSFGRESVDVLLDDIHHTLDLAGQSRDCGLTKRLLV
jgi:hypothetical protein